MFCSNHSINYNIEKYLIIIHSNKKKGLYIRSLLKEMHYIYNEFEIINIIYILNVHTDFKNNNIVIIIILNRYK